uniref:Uncharacterized protein n=1 Tax=Laticauda laticaudata TaxID=8630 RepID=A0A8C5RXM6_LATLA
MHQGWQEGWQGGRHQGWQEGWQAGRHQGWQEGQQAGSKAGSKACRQADKAVNPSGTAASISDRDCDPKRSETVAMNYKPASPNRPKVCKSRLALWSIFSFVRNRPSCYITGVCCYGFAGVLGDPLAKILSSLAIWEIPLLAGPTHPPLPGVHTACFGSQVNAGLRRLQERKKNGLLEVWESAKWASGFQRSVVFLAVCCQLLNSTA